MLGKLAQQHDPNVLVGFDHADDAGVYQIAPDQALVQTVDFFTPIVDDPYAFGQIAATNSLSDVYAMGGKPLTALALVCFPEKADLEILERILAGGLSKMIEAGCTGVISTAIKKGVAKQAWIDAAVTSMTTLNKTAAEVITANHVGADALVRPAEPSSATNSRRPTTNDGFPIHALTDITGFGLIGHLREMLLASENVSAQLHARTIPLLDGAVECVRAGHVPAGLKANREFAECVVRYEGGLADDLKTLLFDPQTAGGLLISVGQESADELIRALTSSGVPAAEIGTVMPRTKVLIEVAP